MRDLQLIYCEHGTTVIKALSRLEQLKNKSSRDYGLNIFDCMFFFSFLYKKTEDS